jgi:hypothetical protein
MDVVGNPLVFLTFVAMIAQSYTGASRRLFSECGFLFDPSSFRRAVASNAEI